MVKNLKQAHTPKTSKNSVNKGDWHVSHTSMGMGDYYGQGIKQPIGRIVDGLGEQQISNRQLMKPPKNLA